LRNGTECILFHSTILFTSSDRAKDESHYEARSYLIQCCNQHSIKPREFWHWRQEGITREKYLDYRGSSGRWQKPFRADRAKLTYLVNSTETYDDIVRNETPHSQSFDLWIKTRQGPLIYGVLSQHALMRIPNNSILFTDR